MRSGLIKGVLVQLRSNMTRIIQKIKPVTEPVEGGAPKKKIIQKVKQDVGKQSFKRPGQKYKTPSKNDGLYVFYTSLLHQRPKSEMALKWCLEHGLLSTKKANDILLSKEFEKKAKLS